jgi:hypothetical protein
MIWIRKKGYSERLAVSSETNRFLNGVHVATLCGVSRDLDTPRGV